MATDKFVKYPSPILHMGVSTTLAGLVEWIADSEQRFVTSAKGLRTGSRLCELFPQEERDPKTNEIVKERTGEIVKVHPDDHAFMLAALEAPSCGYPQLVGMNPETRAPLKIELGRRVLPLVEAWANATDEDPTEAEPPPAPALPAPEPPPAPALPAPEAQN